MKKQISLSIPVVAGIPLWLAGCLGTMDDGLTSGSFVPGSDYYPGTNTFSSVPISGFINTAEDSLSTFGIDVDGASYTYGRNQIAYGYLPPDSSVRVEEYINYFDQEYAVPTVGAVGADIEVGPSLFRSESLQVVRIGLQGVTSEQTSPDWNLTFVIDASGSMETRLPEIKAGLKTLVSNMRSNDHLSIVTYSDWVDTILQPTSLAEKSKSEIQSLIDNIEVQGSTDMGIGLQAGYALNQQSFLNSGVNRVILCSDGDVNSGALTYEEIVALIGDQAQGDIYLTVLGYGEGNYNDALMEDLADNGDGNYYYVDSETESDRLFSDELTSVLEAVAKDVKVQVQFNPEAVARYRLIGYENRSIADSSFSDSTTDAGELGSGQEVTALYEVVLKSGTSNLGMLHVNYVQVSSGVSKSLDVEIVRNDQATGSKRFLFTQVVSEFAEILRGSPYVQTTLSELTTPAATYHNAENSKDVEFLEILGQAQSASSY